MAAFYRGKPPEYWEELEIKANKASDIKDNFRLINLLAEIATLRGKVSLYESRIKELHDFLTAESGNE